MSSNTSYTSHLAPDRFLKACPIRYDCRNLFLYFVEMEYCAASDSVEILVNYPEERDINYFDSEAKLNEFLLNVKRFAFPYVKSLKNDQSASTSSSSSSRNSSLVQFYTFVFTDSNRIRQYGFCRSARGGNHILCMVSYLPWYNVFINLLNNISKIINEKETSSLYHFLEALYEYNLPEPGSMASILSHDGLEQFEFECPDRRILPSIQNNRNLMKFFAFFDLDKLKKIFAGLLLEQSILVVSKDLENLTSCGLSLEYFIYPLEWLHTFVPIVPEHIDAHVFNQPFPFIYGTHTCIYEKLNKHQLENVIVLLVDERRIVTSDGGRDKLPVNIDYYLTKQLDYFKQSGGMQSNSDESRYSMSSAKVNTVNLLSTGSIRPFVDSVLNILGNYRLYMSFDPDRNDYRLDEVAFFKLKNVYTERDSSANSGQKYNSNGNEFYHEFRITQSFEEFCRDRGDYLKEEKEFKITNPGVPFRKDYIDTLIEQSLTENSKFASKFDEKMKSFKEKAKEKSQSIRSNISKTRQIFKKSSSINSDLASQQQQVKKEIPMVISNPISQLPEVKTFEETTSYDEDEETDEEEEESVAEAKTVVKKNNETVDELIVKISSSPNSSSSNEDYSSKGGDSVSQSNQPKSYMDDLINIMSDFIEPKLSSALNLLDLAVDNNTSTKTTVDTAPSVLPTTSSNLNTTSSIDSNLILSVDQSSIAVDQSQRSSSFIDPVKSSQLLSQTNSLDSVLKEFDPFSQTSMFNSHQTSSTTKPAASTMTSLMAPKPFQVTQSNANRPQQTIPTLPPPPPIPARPNYNIVLPRADPVGPNVPTRSVVANHPPAYNPYMPQPFYAAPPTSLMGVYRPVQFNYPFMPPNNDNSTNNNLH